MTTFSASQHYSGMAIGSWKAGQDEAAGKPALNRTSMII
jgi:hypothetical protein